MDTQTIGIIVALIGVLKGKDIWDYLKSRNEHKHKDHDKIIEIYEVQISDLKAKIREHEKRMEYLVLKLEQKIAKSRGKKEI
jgi:hypothetical protein